MITAEEARKIVRARNDEVMKRVYAIVKAAAEEGNTSAQLYDPEEKIDKCELEEAGFTVVTNRYAEIVEISWS